MTQSSYPTANWEWMNRAFMYWILETVRVLGVEKTIEIDKSVVSKLGKRMAQANISFNKTHWSQENLEVDYDGNSLIATVKGCTAQKWLKENGVEDYPCHISHGGFLQSYWDTALPNKAVMVEPLFEVGDKGCTWKISIQSSPTTAKRPFKPDRSTQSAVTEEFKKDIER